MTENTEKFTRETITSITTWVPSKLFSFTCTRPSGYRFTAGQFARLGVENTLQMPNEPNLIWRAYSMVSGPYDDSLEFFSIVVPEGAFTSHLSQLKVGDTICIDKTSYGFLTTSRFECGSDLWLLGSGTGLAPFLSILHDPATWEQFDHIYLVHSARTAQELVYQDMINSFEKHPLLSEIITNIDQRFHYVPVVTRELIENTLNQRIPQLLKNGSLEAFTQQAMTVERSRFMICGNPSMVSDIRESLKNLGFTPARQSKPGQVAVENYW